MKMKRRQRKRQQNGRRTGKEKGHMNWHDSLIEKLESTRQPRMPIEEGKKNVLAWNNINNDNFKKNLKRREEK